LQHVGRRAMGWMDLSEYVLIEEAARDRLGDLRVVRRGTPPKEATMSTLAKLLYIASALRAGPRAIDRYIDYFGGRTPSPR
jgi:hypothetical protein